MVAVFALRELRRLQRRPSQGDELMGAADFSPRTDWESAMRCGATRDPCLLGESIGRRLRLLRAATERGRRAGKYGLPILLQILSLVR